MRYEIGELTIGQLLDVGFSVFKDNYKPLLGVAGMAFAPVFAVFLAAMVSGAVPMFNPMDMMFQPGAQPPDPEMLARQFQSMAILMPAMMLVTTVCTLFGHGAMVLTAASNYLGQSVTAGEAMKFSLSRWWALLKTAFALFLIFILGYLLMAGIMVGAIALMDGTRGFFVGVPLLLILMCAIFYIMIRYCLSMVVTILEDVSGFSALKRSAFLMKKTYGKTFVVFLLVGFASMIPSTIINAFIMVPGVPFFLVYMVGMTVVQMLLLVFMTTIVTVLYFSNRCKHENFDLVLLAEEAAA